MGDTRAPWERQSWETDQQYIAFQTYRDMPRPRSVDGAYRIHFASMNGLQASDRSVARKRAVGGWQNWSRGRDWKGKAIPDAQTWEERANAYDTDTERRVQAQFEENLLQERTQLVRDELADYQLQLSKWREVWGRTRVQVRRKTSDDEEETITVEINVDDWLKLARWRDSISEQGRRALSMPDKIMQNQVTGKDGGAVKLDLLHVDDMAAVFREMAAWEQQEQGA